MNFIYFFLFGPSAVQCETPDNPENGKVIYTTKSYNSVVTYECNYGFMIVGSATRRCGPDKKWTDEKPECRGWFTLILF